MSYQPSWLDKALPPEVSRCASSRWWATKASSKVAVLALAARNASSSTIASAIAAVSACKGPWLSASICPAETALAASCGAERAAANSSATVFAIAASPRSSASVEARRPSTSPNSASLWRWVLRSSVGSSLATLNSCIARWLISTCAASKPWARICANTACARSWSDLSISMFDMVSAPFTDHPDAPAPAMPARPSTRPSAASCRSSRRSSSTCRRTPHRHFATP